MKFQSVVLLLIVANLAADQSASQTLTITINSPFVVDVDKDLIILDVDEDHDPSSNFPVTIIDPIVLLQASTGMQVLAPLKFTIYVSFVPTVGGNQLTWDGNDYLILTGDSFNTANLWDGSQALKNFIVKSNGTPGFNDYDYFYSYARLGRMKPPGKLEGTVIFTVTLDES